MHFILSEHDRLNSIDLISPFCKDKYSMTSAHFRFQCETFDNQFDGRFFVCVFFFNFQGRTVTSVSNELSLKISSLVADNKAYRVL